MSGYGIPIDERRAVLNAYRKSTLVLLCRVKSGEVLPLSDYARWRKDELVAEILRIEYPPPEDSHSCGAPCCTNCSAGSEFPAEASNG